jgi:hypothetical protein
MAQMSLAVADKNYKPHADVLPVVGPPLRYIAHRPIIVKPAFHRISGQAALGPMLLSRLPEIEWIPPAPAIVRWVGLSIFDASSYAGR